MFVISLFTEGGVAKTGLSPLITIWDSDAVVVVNAAAMSEIAGGFYRYDFSTYDDTKTYCYQADGTATLSNAERYKFGTNEAEQDKIKYILGLVQSNFRLLTPVYNGSNKLTSCTIKTYPTAMDCTNDTNVLKTYSLAATYDGVGNMDTYEVVEA
jgi:hypothetical protein